MYLINEFISSAPRHILANQRSFSNPMKPEKDRTADTICVIGETEYIVDVTVRNPSAPSYYEKSVSDVLSGAEDIKRKAYVGYLPLPSVFIPFAVDLNGNLGVSAVEFLNKLFAHDTSKDRVVLKAFKRRLSLLLARDLNTLFVRFHSNMGRV